MAGEAAKAPELEQVVAISRELLHAVVVAVLAHVELLAAVAHDGHGVEELARAGAPGAEHPEQLALGIEGDDAVVVGVGDDHAAVVEHAGPLGLADVALGHLPLAEQLAARVEHQHPPAGVEHHDLAAWRDGHAPRRGQPGALGR